MNKMHNKSDRHSHNIYTKVSDFFLFIIKTQPDTFQIQINLLSFMYKFTSSYVLHICDESSLISHCQSIVYTLYTGPLYANIYNNEECCVPPLYLHLILCIHYDDMDWVDMIWRKNDDDDDIKLFGGMFCNTIFIYYY